MPFQTQPFPSLMVQKSVIESGSPIPFGNQMFSYRQRASSSILSAQLQAIFQCLEHILTLPIPTSHTFLIVSDSLPAPTAVANVHSTHPLVTRIHTMLTTHPFASLTVLFVWVPSHRGIPGNENVNSGAEVATILPCINSQILPTKSDLALFIRRQITNQWVDLWQKQGLTSKLVQIKPLPFACSSSHQIHRHHEIYLTCLRIGPYNASPTRTSSPSYTHSHVSTAALCG